MKKITLALITITTLWVVACKTQQKATYEFPAEMLAPVKADYVKQWEKGKMLYEINCARCHTKREHGKEVLPDFDLEELQAYEIRGGNVSHENNITEEKVSAEELGNIITFLTYRKKTAENSYKPKTEEHTH